MLEITIPKQHYEFYNESENEFSVVDVKETTIQMEHSLISLKKWEQKWQKPFLNNDQKSKEEQIDYFRCMTLSKNIDPNVYNWIPIDELNKIMEYIKNPMTATTIWFRGNKTIGAQKNQNETVTAELIYYWMIALMIPIEFEKWHLNQLLTLIQVVNIKNGKDQKLDKVTAAKERDRLNAKRRAMLKSKG